MRLFRYLLLISFLLSLPTLADTAPETGVAASNARELVLPLTKATAADLAKSDTDARVLSVHEETYQGIAVFRVKVLHGNGTVKTYRIERDSGKRL